MRLKRLEIAVHNHNRRLDDHDSLHAKDVIWKGEVKEEIGMMHKILQENQKQTAIFMKQSEDIIAVREYAQKTYEVFHPLAKIASTAIKFGALATIVWHGAKLVAAKIGLVLS